MVCHWAHKLLGYHFTIIHRINKIVADVDDLTRRFEHLVNHHISISDILISSDHANLPCVCAATEFPTLVTSILQRLKTLQTTHSHSSQAMSFTSFLKISPLIKTQYIH